MLLGHCVSHDVEDVSAIGVSCLLQVVTDDS